MIYHPHLTHTLYRRTRYIEIFLTPLLMSVFGIFFVLFGITILLMPQILAYLIGGFFIFIGVNAIAFSLRNTSK
jgi:uncharacterized membrane protein HdeD (DUF308 family)